MLDSRVGMNLARRVLLATVAGNRLKGRLLGEDGTGGVEMSKRCRRRKRRRRGRRADRMCDGGEGCLEGLGGAGHEVVGGCCFDAFGYLTVSYLDLLVVGCLPDTRPPRGRYETS